MKISCMKRSFSKEVEKVLELKASDICMVWRWFVCDIPHNALSAVGGTVGGRGVRCGLVGVLCC